tara:strand:- start:189 stop:881 length:693 start_codon:yes stop_codon:yes gene_type:complete
MSVDGIWLASASKRRATLLNKFISTNNFEIKLFCVPLIEDEVLTKCSTLEETVFSITKTKMENAFLEISLGRLEKSECFKHPQNVISIVSDTIVEDPDSFEQLFGKAKDILEATSMLKILSGRKHKVWTSTGLVVHNSIVELLELDLKPEIIFDEWFGYIWTEFSTVEIDELSDEILHQLLESNSWKGKAGGYDLDGQMSDYAKVIDGKKITVLGLAAKAIENLEKIIKT